MNSGSYLIIPKYKIDRIDKLRDELKMISQSKNFEVVTELELDFKTNK